MSRGRIIVIILLLSFLSLAIWSNYGIFTFPSYAPLQQDIALPETLNIAEAKSFPANSIVQNSSNVELVAPLSITTPDDGKIYYIKMKHTEDNGKNIVIYMESNETTNANIPLGDYWLYYAYGTVWYGDEELFGINTLSFKIDATISFYETDTSIIGNTIFLDNIDGNLSGTPISKSEMIED